jgi:hypothetical protein
MGFQKRKNPAIGNLLANRNALWFGVALLAIPALCLVGLGFLANSLPLIIPGFLIIVIPVLVLTFIAKPTAEKWSLVNYAQAEVVDRHQEKSKAQWSGEWLDIFLIVYYRFNPPYDHQVDLRFDATGVGGIERPIKVSAQVTKKLYEKLSPGSSVLVQYAADDPYKVCIEGEYRWLEPADSPV